MSGTLTVSGNEITDATRATNTQGDGLAAPAGFGIWEATTNFCTNGGFETGTAGAATNIGTETISRDATASKFGTASLKVVTPGGVVGEGTEITVGGLTNGATYTMSAWVTAPAGASMKMACNNSLASSFVGTGSPQRVVVTGVLSGFTSQVIDIVTTTTAQAITFHVDGVQVEQKSYATPYVETNGATASRSAASVAAPSSLLSSTQGWFAARVNMGWAKSAGPSAKAAFASWYFSGGYIWLWANNTGVGAGMNDGHGGNVDASPIATWNSGDHITVIGKWTPSTVACSFNGGAFAPQAQALSLPASGSTFNIGHFPTFDPRFIDSSVLWFACGTGTLTDADAATINGWGDTVPNMNSLAGTAAAMTAVMPMVTSTYLNLVTAASSLSLTDSFTAAGTPTKFAASSLSLTNTRTAAGVPTKFASASLRLGFGTTTTGIRNLIKASPVSPGSIALSPVSPGSITLLPRPFN
jgi:hypothetical protein